jgi:hypothetical protein
VVVKGSEFGGDEAEVSKQEGKRFSRRGAESAKVRSKKDI